MEKRGRGRPRKDTAKRGHMSLRVSDDDVRELAAGAEREGKPVTVFVLDAALERARTPRPPRARRAPKV